MNAPRLDDVDLSLHLDEDAYETQLRTLQHELRDVVDGLYAQRRTMVLVFEGWDAAGKGGAIRRLVRRVDPRDLRVHAIGAPAGEDAERHYLWRFWRRLDSPSARRLVIFDRSWYGRVLVERVEGFAEPADWRRAYAEIVGFEEQLLRAGLLLGKFWLHVSDAEQLRRFEARRDTPHKRWKLTEEDWRNRARRGDYEAAVDEMFRRTHTADAPWTPIAGDDKRWARVAVLRRAVEIGRAGLDDRAGSP
ncbi:MAG: hypothetical protein AAGN46_15015 [Acidobacteriota bacterium]